MMFRAINALLALLLILFSSALWAAPGDLDTTFGDGKGWVSTGFRLIKTTDLAYSIIKQSDGKLVVAGYSSSNDDDGHKGFALMRYNLDGTLDTTFDGDGKLITDVNHNADDYAYSVIQQADGKLVVTGLNSLVRYNTDGSLDTAFDSDGKVTTIGFEARSVIQQSDGRLVVAGGRYNPTTQTYDFAVARYNIDGTLDAAFDGDGEVTTAVGGQAEGAYAVIQQSDGKIVVAGDGGFNIDFAIVRYNSDGTLDTTFDGDGKLITDIGSRSSDNAYSVIQQTDGKLVVAGSSNNDFAVARYNSNGTLDTTFDSDGKVTTDFGSLTDIAYKVVEQSDGKLVVAGESMSSFALARYNTNGSLDTTFDSDGKLTSSIGALDRAQDVVQQADGKLVAIGWTRFGSPWESNLDFSLVRYNIDGSLDSTFDSDGKLNTDFGRSDDRARTAVKQSDGKLVVAGTTYADHSMFALARYNIDGSLDTSFGNDGKINTDLGQTNPNCYSVIQQNDGKLVAAGYRSNSEIVLVRYNMDGTLDTSFSDDGILTSNISTFNDQAYSVIQQSDGKLVVAGYSGDYYYEDFIVLRYNIDGSLDSSFGSGGIVITAVGMSDDIAYSIIQQADGKLVVTGSSRVENDTNLVVIRYNSNGSLDTAFNNNGMLIISTPAFYVNAIIQQADNKLVITGSAWNLSLGGFQFGLVRLNTDGTLDSAFINHGLLPYDTSEYSNGYALSVAQQADGKLVVAGYGYNDGSRNDFVVARYQTDGSPDASFGSNGKRTFNISDVYDYAYSVIQQDDGKLLVIGYSEGMPTGNEFVVARIESGQLDTDSDGIVDWFDTDNDNDGVPNASDNCPLITNANQLDVDGEGVGDVCDVFPNNATEWLDTDGDGIGNNADIDDDNDGVSDTQDCYPLDNMQFACAAGTYPTGTGFAQAPAGSYAINGLLTECLAETYQPLMGQTSCITATTCSVNQYQSTAPTATTDRVCSALATCNPDEYESTASTATTNRVCSVRKQNDFSPDGKADILLRNTTTGDWNLAQLNGLTVLNQSTVGAFSDIGSVIVSTVDFNGDGKADILTRGTDDGLLPGTFHIDTTDGATVTGSAWLFTMSTDLDDKVMSTKDFNKDGKADVLLRNSLTGIWTLNLMSGVSDPNIDTLNASTNTCYTMKGDGDYDGNGYPDILLRKDACGGASYPWLVTLTDGNFTVLSSAVPPIVSMNTAWAAVVTDKDFNSDGKSDILMRALTGSVQQWLLYDMNGTNAPSASGLLNIPVQSVWQFAADADFNGDGNADILLRSTDTGQWYADLLNGRTILASGVINTAMNPIWVLQGIDDNNGDGKSDILLRNSANGQWYLNLMNGLIVQSKGILNITTDLSYVLQND